MLLDFLGGMARQGTKILDEKREIQNKIDLTEKLTEIELKAKQRAAANARAAKRKENTMNAMQMLLPLTGGDEALAQQIYAQHGENWQDIASSGLSLKSMGIDFVKDGQLNPLVYMPDVEAQGAVYENLAINGNDEQKADAKKWLAQRNQIQNIGKDDGFDVTLSNKIDTSLKNVLNAAAGSNPSIDGDKLDITITTSGMVTSDDPRFTRWLVETVQPLMEDRLREFPINPNRYHLYLQPYVPVSYIPSDNINTNNDQDDFQPGMTVK